MNLMETLKLIKNTDLNNYNSDIEEKILESFNPYLLFMWLSGTKNKKEISQLDRINPLFFAKLTRNDNINKKILLKLLIASTVPEKNPKFSWEIAKNNKPSLKCEIIKEFYDLSTSEAFAIMNLFKKSEVVKLAQFLGYDEGKIKKVKNIKD